MNISHSTISSEVVCRLIFLWLIHSDCIFGCLSTNYRRKDGLHLTDTQKRPPSDDTFETLSDLPSNKEMVLITKFRDFLSQKYNWKIRTSNLKSLWSKLKEFTLATGRQSTVRKTNETGMEFNFYNGTTITIHDIELFLKADKNENKLMGVLNMGEGPKIISRERKRYFVPDEMFHAMQSAQAFHYHACGLRNSTFCSEKYLKEEQNFNDLYQFLPPAFNVKRCPKTCSCLQPNEDCLPTSIKSRIEYILTIAVNGEKSTWQLKLDDHSGCRCRDRCLNRTCIHPFQLKVYRRGVCKCVCNPGMEKKCSKLNEGYSTFSNAEYKCLLNGTCIPPSCRAGELSEENLYLKRCSKVLFES